MNSKDYLHGSSEADSKDRTADDVLESLFSHVDARKRAPQTDERAVREALHSEWVDIARRRKRKAYFVYGIAASFLLAAVISINMLNQEPGAPVMQQVAAVEKQSGNIFVHLSDEQSSRSRRLASGGLYAGQVLTTAQDARLAVTMNAGETIRIDENTRLVFMSGQQIELLDGQIYVDSNHSGTNNSQHDVLEIKTFAGVVRHLGTQYMTGIDNSLVAVSVREGQVMLVGDHSESIARPGEQIKMSRSGETSISSISTHGSLWEWAELVTPQFSLDGRSALDFINWVGRETGRVVDFAPDGAEQLARSTILRGSIDLEPMRALDLILQTSDLEPMIDDGTILIRTRQGT
jgi:hypothetical protein